MLDPLGALQIGSLTITNFVIALFITAISTIFLLSWWLKREGIDEHEQVLSQVQNGLVIGVIIYKLWPFILSPMLFLSPRNLILYAGGPWAIEASVFLAVVWVIFQWWRGKWPIELIDSFAAVLFVGLIIHSVLLKEFGGISIFPIGFQMEENVYHSLNLYKALTYTIFLFFAFNWINRGKKGSMALFLLISIIITHYLLVPFDF